MIELKGRLGQGGRVSPQLLPALVYLVIFGIGLAYAYFRTFTMLATHDDEGVMMAIVQAYVQNPASYDSIKSIYGPFYLLHKYLIHAVFGLEVSHDITRFTTIVFWGLIALVGAVFVHRLTRSLVLAAIAQLLLLLHLSPLVGSPGHAQESALLLTVIALLLSSCMATPQGRRLALGGLGFCVVALALVKINLGVYMGVPLALAVISCVPRNAVQQALLVMTALGALLLPAVIMRNHIGSPSEVQNFCVVVTLVIAACLVASWRKPVDPGLQWLDVGWVAAVALASVLLICGAILVGGGTVMGIVDAIVLRALKWSSFPRRMEGFESLLVAATIGSGCLVLGWRLLSPRQSGMRSLALPVALVKLGYGLLVLVSVYWYSSSFIMQAIPLPFIWIVLLEADDQDRSLETWFPRLFLCLLAVFQVLQMFPKIGVQLSWAGILMIPVALVCLGDAVRELLPRLRKRWPGFAAAVSHNVFAALLLCAAGVLFYQKAEYSLWQDRFARTNTLDLPGADRVRVNNQVLRPLRQLVGDIRKQCDGFVSVPGFPSLYFWSEISPPTVYPFAWALGGLAENGQQELMSAMQDYERPCVVLNGRRLRGWIDRKADEPLMQYLNSGFRKYRAYGPFTLQLDNERMDAIDRASTDAAGGKAGTYIKAPRLVNQVSAIHASTGMKP